MVVMRRTIARVERVSAQPHDGSRSANTRAGDEAILDLYCFPYAGAATWAVYDSWSQELPDDICSDVRIQTVDIRATASRNERPASTSLPALVDDLLENFDEQLRPPFILLGHSMGALISFEIARALRRRNLAGPEHLIISGHRAPQLPRRRSPVHAESDSVLLARLRELDGTPPEVLQNRELLELFLPRLRSDLTICETYDYQPEPPLSCSITALGGTRDPEVDRDDLRAWGNQTTSAFSFYTFPGGHFFPQTAKNLVLRVVAEDLRRVQRRLPQAS
jgi:medium-chain acyl-[acyl-carrier-protein] hydrolase